ncbi:LacI family DNA-binding transcriptional regulator [Prauserella muralis]|uniref:LacI family transcriptional regulator n=1 Tax=Prauserella muralis TaxID=588067 RepID=A0A2V4B0F5_9PSEU|nr:LacI family DNA-binding transcriptional regulator [Prauserella muralis]PXY27674.1 LacI family transcriptional regulator [Prauserella muralis]TWE22592.1 LacI family transcriptional regulator [Prauserella muralis]
MARQPALTDVAALAGVSHMTVSRVINGNGSVRAETRRRVLAAVEELGYRPNSLARALATGRSRALGVVALDSVLYGPASTLFGIENAARESGYGISIASVGQPDGSSIAGAVEDLRLQGVEGIVVIAPHVATGKVLEGIPRDLPLVAVADTDQAPVPVVAVDQGDGARRVTEHLLALGHETVWHVAGPEDWLDATARERAWRTTLTEWGAELPPVSRGDWSPRSGYEAGRELLDHGGVTAVFVANDQMALGVLRAFSEAGVSVPGDVHVAGYDDVPEAAYFSPPLTTVRQDFIALGRTTFGQLSRQIEGEKPASRSIVPAELIVRESTGPRRV